MDHSDTISIKINVYGIMKDIMDRVDPITAQMNFYDVTNCSNGCDFDVIRGALLHHAPIVAQAVGFEFGLFELAATAGIATTIGIEMNC